jgi:predicted DNA-binding transcriptional regulator AlpA
MKKLLDYKQVAEKLGIDKASFWTYIQSKESFPKRVLIGPRSSRWVDEEVDEWLETLRSNNDGRSSREAKEVDQRSE